MIKSFFHKLFHKIYIIGRHIDQGNQYDGFRTKYTISPGFRFNGDHIYFYGEGQICIGDKSYIGEFSTILGGSCPVSGHSEPGDPGTVPPRHEPARSRHALVAAGSGARRWTPGPRWRS